MRLGAFPLFLALATVGCAPPTRDEELEKWLVEQREAARPMSVEPTKPSAGQSAPDVDLLTLQSPFQPPRPVVRKR